jgi:hypothetical protein
MAHGAAKQFNDAASQFSAPRRHKLVEPRTIQRNGVARLCGVSPSYLLHNLVQGITRLCATSQACGAAYYSTKRRRKIVRRVAVYLRLHDLVQASQDCVRRRKLVEPRTI